MKIKLLWLTAYCLLLTATLSAQTNLVQVSDNVYQFLDRMTVKGVINSNEFSKPLSRREIAEYLSKIYEKNSELNKVEKEELDWYLHEYTNETASLYSLSPYPPIPFVPNSPRWRLYEYSDSLFHIALSPIAGLKATSIYDELQLKRWWGFKLFGNVTENFSF